MLWISSALESISHEKKFISFWEMRMRRKKSCYLRYVGTVCVFREDEGEGTLSWLMPGTAGLWVHRLVCETILKFGEEQSKYRNGFDAVFGFQWTHPLGKLFLTPVLVLPDCKSRLIYPEWEKFPQGQWEHSLCGTKLCVCCERCVSLRAFSSPGNGLSNTSQHQLANRSCCSWDFLTMTPG